VSAVLPVLPVLASPRRQEILRLVWDEERCAGDIHAAMPDVTFGAVSLQLKALAGAGLVTVRAAGRHRYYRARRELRASRRGPQPGPRPPRPVARLRPRAGARRKG
jgi:DNA-binding transcriptional ArsR family regulator